MYDVLDITDQFKDYSEVAKLLDIEINPVGMYQAFYKQHKNKTKTFRHLKEPDYSRKMNNRIDWVFCQMNLTIESKISYLPQTDKLV